MAVNVQRMERVFEFDGRMLPDPNPEASVEQVRDMYIPSYPDITTASVVGPATVDGRIKYTFQRAVGTKG